MRVLPAALCLTGSFVCLQAVWSVIGAWCNWRCVAEPLRLYTECACDAPTLSDYFTRFADDKRLLRVFAARVPLAFFAIYSASCIVAGGAPLQ